MVKEWCGFTYNLSYCLVINDKQGKVTSQLQEKQFSFCTVIQHFHCKVSNSNYSSFIRKRDIRHLNLGIDKCLKNPGHKTSFIPYITIS